MQNFTFNTPTRVEFGAGKENEVGTLLRAYGASKVLIHYGGGSVIKSGLLERVTRSVEDAGLSYVCKGGVKPNPRLSEVYEAIALCREEKVDFILAVGGGSVIDASKAVGYGLATDRDVWDFFVGRAVPTATVPVGCILTLAATGSEMSNSCVITNDDTWQKRPCDNDVGRPVFSILNPELTYSLPEYQTRCGCTDIMMHTLERYFHNGDTLDITDGIAEYLLKDMMRVSKEVLEHPRDYALRAEIMWCGSLSHNGLTACGGGGGDWAVHMIEHELGGKYDVAHGAGLSAIWGTWARAVYPRHRERFLKLAKNVLDVRSDGDEAIEEGIARMEAFFRSIGMPVSIGELGVVPTEEELRDMAEKCTRYGDVGGMEPLNCEAVYRILKDAQ